MKKSLIWGIVLIAIFLLGTSDLNAIVSKNNAGKCPSKPYKKSNAISKNIQKFTGINLLTSFTVSEIAEMNISKQLKSKKTDLDLKLYSAGDLISGRLRDFSLYIKRPNIDGLSLDEVKAESLCEYTDVDYTKKPLFIKTPIYLKYAVSLGDKEIAETLASKTYSELLDNIPLEVSGQNIGKLKINSVKAKISGGKITLGSSIGYEGGIFSFKIPVDIESSLAVKDNAIYLVKFKIYPDGVIGKGYDLISSLMKLDNIKLLDIDSVKTPPFEVKLNKLNIVNNKIKAEGTVFIPGNTTLQ